MAAKSKIAAAKKVAAKAKSKKAKSYAPQNPPQSKSYREPNDRMVAAKPVGWRWTTLGASRLGRNETSRPSVADVEKYKGKTFRAKGEDHAYLYSEKRVDKSDKNRSQKFESGGTMGAGSFEKGGGVRQTAPQSEVYRKSNDRKVEAKPVGWRYKGNNYNEPSARVISREKNKSREDRNIYFETRKDKSDHDFYNKLESGGTLGAGSFKKGGATFGGRQYHPYREPLDADKTAKPIGWRFTDKLAKRLGKSPYSRPTVADVEKYAGRGVYYENRQDKSDASPSKKYRSLESGGTMGAGSFARGGVQRIANTQAREYTENLIPFKGANLEGKTLDNGDYVVLSYGYYPIWWYCKSQGKWYGNSTKYSVTTSKQTSQSRPTYDATMLSKSDLTDAMMKQHSYFEDGGVLDGILSDLSSSGTSSVGGTTFSQGDLTPQMDITNPAF